MNVCYICGAKAVAELLDLGKQPICNRYLSDRDADEYRHPLMLGQCTDCGLIQMSSPVPASELLPRFDWITYNEPEGHLDDLVEILCSLPGVSKHSMICGISFKDDSTLGRFQKRGLGRIWRLDTKRDLGVNDPRAGIETVQVCLTPEAAKGIGRKRGLADIVIVRHILEHAHSPIAFISALKQLVKPDGYIVFEVPDCARALEILDYTMIWEEHTRYFTASTFRHSLISNGFSLADFRCYPYPFENSLVAVVRLQDTSMVQVPAPERLDTERRRARLFSESFPVRLHKLRAFFAEYRQHRGRIALFGAGHLATTFLNLLRLSEYIEFVVDDDPNKCGLFMPGSRLPIYRPEAIAEKEIRLCLLSVNPVSEDRVMSKNEAFMDRGGTFASIFPASKNAIQI